MCVCVCVCVCVLGEGRGGGGLYDEDETTEEEEEEEEEDEDERGVRKTAGLAEVRLCILCTILIQLLYMCSKSYSECMLSL